MNQTGPRIELEKFAFHFSGSLKSVIDDAIEVYLGGCDCVELPYTTVVCPVCRAFGRLESVQKLMDEYSIYQPYPEIAKPETERLPV